MRALNSLAAKMSEKWEMLHFPLWEKGQALLDRNKNVIQQPDLEPFLWLFIYRRWQTQQRVSSACQCLLTLLWDIRFWLLNLWTPAEHVSSASSAAAEVWETDAAVIRTGIQPVCVPPTPPPLMRLPPSEQRGLRLRPHLNTISCLQHPGVWLYQNNRHHRHMELGCLAQKQLLPLKRLTGAKQGRLQRAAALQHPAGIPSRLSKA